MLHVTIDLTIDASGKASVTLHKKKIITTFSLPLSQAIAKCQELIKEDFERLRAKQTCSCGKLALESPTDEKDGA